VSENTTPQPITVLVVEDESMLRSVVSNVLRKRGFAVIEVGDGDSALQAFGKHAKDIDVVLLDVTLPGISGTELLAELRKIRSDVRVMLTSGYTSEILGNAFDQHQLLHFVRKPYLIGELVNQLKKTAAK
jgi:DNA-binding response OmpR family regulator